VVPWRPLIGTGSWWRFASLPAPEPANGRWRPPTACPRPTVRGSASGRPGGMATAAPAAARCPAAKAAMHRSPMTCPPLWRRRSAGYAAIPEDVPEALKGALKARGIERLDSHQAQAGEATQRGEHVAIVTPTASGKSLCYTLPVVSAAMQGNAKALYLFPTKALAQDQVAELLELNRAGDLGVKAFTFDGDTPGDARQAIRLHGDIVVSNPDMLHQAILPHHTKWAQFFENLRYVVIDEIHTYRGVFGSHVTNVLRRLKR